MGEGEETRKMKNRGSAGDDGKGEKAPFLFSSQCSPRALVSILPRLLALTLHLSPFPSPYEKKLEEVLEASAEKRARRRFKGNKTSCLVSVKCLVMSY